MSAPFDTLKLARQFEAAGFEHKQAGDMAQAIAEAQASADPKTDLRDLEQRLKIWTGSIAAAVVAMLVAVLHLWPPH
jgi:hypothetical protein